MYSLGNHQHHLHYVLVKIVSVNLTASGLLTLSAHVVTLFVCLSVCLSVADLENDGLLALQRDTNLKNTTI